MPAHLAGVIGCPVDHSLSPVLHRAAYEALGLTGWAYERHTVGGAGGPQVAEFLAGLDERWRGVSVTMPGKEAALAAAVRATDRARSLGAANTLVRVPDGWAADNTDPYGVLEALLRAGVRGPRRAVVLGSGATARSVLDALVRLGVRHVVFGVRGEVRGPTADFAERAGLTWSQTRLADAADLGGVPWDVLVGTLPTGTGWAPAPVGADRLRGRVVLDVVYDAWPTPLARWAGAGGATVVSGLEMLLYQAVEQVELMTGRGAPVGAMREALARSVGFRGIDAR